MSRTRRRGAMLQVRHHASSVESAPEVKVVTDDLALGAADDEEASVAPSTGTGGTVKPRRVLHRLGRITGMNWFRDRRLIRLPR